MKYKIDALIVVEGKSDINFLSTFIDAKFYSVNGSALSKDDIVFLKEYTKNNKIIILTDPDYPGMKIRNTLNESLNSKNIYNAYIRKKYSIKNHKVGVAESTIEEVLNSLKEIKNFNNENIASSNLEMNDLYALKLAGFNSKELRNKFTDQYFLGYSNSKQLLKKLQLLGINKQKLEEMLKNVK